MLPHEPAGLEAYAFSAREAGIRREEEDAIASLREAHPDFPVVVAAIPGSMDDRAHGAAVVAPLVAGNRGCRPAGVLGPVLDGRPHLGRSRLRERRLDRALRLGELGLRELRFRKGRLDGALRLREPRFRGLRLE